jgi:hypothetical protein
VKPKKVPLVIYQGSTLQQLFYWYSSTEVTKAISAIVNGYPTVLTTGAVHGLPDSDIPVSILGVPSWLDTDTPLANRIYASKVDTTNFSVKVNGIDQDAYDGTGGVLVYNAPMDLANWSARMQIRESVDSDVVIAEFTSTDGQIALGSDGSISLTDTDTVTDALDFSAAVYDLELVDPDGNVYRPFEGPVSLSKQVTRP